MASQPNSSSQDRLSVDIEQGPDTMLKEYILERDRCYRELLDLKEKGWRNPAGDEYFKQQRERADNSKRVPGQAQRFFFMMQRIGDELQQATSALTPQLNPRERLRVLDLCMAPGGYSASALKYNRKAVLHGISLRESQGGHKLLLEHSDLNVIRTDITMLAAEFCESAIPPKHPDTKVFRSRRPFLNQSYHLIFCDGQVLRTHPRGPHREQLEPLRLTVSQLILALQRIKAGGTLIMLLHKADTWRNFLLLYKFSLFSDVELFKPARKHADRSSFYIVAKNVQPASLMAQVAVKGWRADWWRATFGGEDSTGGAETVQSDESVRRLIRDFGARYLSLVGPIFDVQRKALAQKDYVR